MTFLKAAYEILKEKKKPLHSREVLRLALKKRLIKTKGKTPEATMNAQILREIKSKGTESRFKKVGPSTFIINPRYKEQRRVKTEKAKKDKKPLSEEFVKSSIIKWLSRQGWGFFDFNELHSHGVDIKARNGGRVIFIEAKGESESRQGNEVAFVYGLGQIVTRMKVIDARYAYNYGLGLPESSARIAVRRIPWQVARKVCLYVFSVNRDGKVKKYSWQDLKRVQSKT